MPRGTAGSWPWTSWPRSRRSRSFARRPRTSRSSTAGGLSTPPATTSCSSTAARLPRSTRRFGSRSSSRTPTSNTSLRTGCSSGWECTAARSSSTRTGSTAPGSTSRLVSSGLHARAASVSPSSFAMKSGTRRRSRTSARNTSRTSRIRSTPSSSTSPVRRCCGGRRPPPGPRSRSCRSRRPRATPTRSISPTGSSTISLRISPCGTSSRSSRATRRSPTRARPSTLSSSARSSAPNTSWSEACDGSTSACASRPSCSRRRPGSTSGQTVGTRRWTTRLPPATRSRRRFRSPCGRSSSGPCPSARCDTPLPT